MLKHAVIALSKAAFTTPARALADCGRRSRRKDARRDRFLFVWFGRLYRIPLSSLNLLLALAFFGSGVAFSSSGLAEPPTTEYKVKAAMVYKLIKFVRWPGEEQPQASAESGQIRICILGEDPFGSAIDAVAGKTVRDIPIAIQRQRRIDQVPDDCQVLFVAASMEPYLKEVLVRVAGQPVLTIGDVAQFAESGGIIELTTVAKRIGFKVNQRSVTASGLQIAAPLLSLATLIE